MFIHHLVVRATARRFWPATLLALFALPLPLIGADTAVPQERVSFDAGWHFHAGDPTDAGDGLDYARAKNWLEQTGLEFTKTNDPAATLPAEPKPGERVSFAQPQFDDSGWRALNLPHDWGVEGQFTQAYPGETGKLPWWGKAWYRKSFAVPAGDQGKRLFLDVDGAMAYSEVWLNGHFLGGWPFGYASWRLELTPYVNFGGTNVVAIRLANPPASSRWYPGGGIYRNVWLVKTDPVHVIQWGTYITTPQITPDAAAVNLQVSVINQSASLAPVRVSTKIFRMKSDGQKTGTAVAAFAPVPLSFAPGATLTATQSGMVPQPRLWSIETPNRYVAVTTITESGEPISQYETPFGIRSIEFTITNGFLLNGRRVALQGVCDHHDLGPLGSALNGRALERQVQLLKEMGCNAIRTSHNPPSPELLDLCDRLGLVVMDEAFDCWVTGKGKNTNDYHVLFPDWHEKDLRAMIRRDRNHPCVILWSIGNEIIEQIQVPAGHVVGAELARIAHEEDPTRRVTAASNHPEAATNGFQKVVDVFGFNYHPWEYGKFRAANPTIPVIGSETASCVSSRGEYFFPLGTNQKPARINFQVSSYDLSAPEWATSPDDEFAALDAHPFVAGEFVWTGFDYLGEPTPYWSDTTNVPHFTNPDDQLAAEAQLQEFGKVRVPSRSSYFGILDLCGFKKDRFYIYQAHWRPDFPMAHMLPHWNWPERIGQVTPVHVYTSGDEAELFLNGRSLGRKKKGPLEYRLRWDDVVYQPGMLKVVAYKNGRHWAEDTVQTTGAAAKLKLQADRTTVRADGYDLSYVTVTIADQNGLLVPRTKNLVRFALTGPGEIAGVDSGDPTSHEPMQAMQHRAFNGLCLVIIRTQAGRSGKITLHAASDGLTEAEVVIRSR